jgi:hypothetical protein
MRGTNTPTDSHHTNRAAKTISPNLNKSQQPLTQKHSSKKEKAPEIRGPFQKESGDFLLSHT